MSNSQTLRELYTDEMKDLWSANDQMIKVVKEMSSKAHDVELRNALEQSIKGIENHAQTLRSLIRQAGAEVEKEHCKGMEGLVKEASKHIGSDAPAASELLDIVIIAQYQRMSHYGLAGFGTAAAYAKALGMFDQHQQLTRIVGEIYAGDEYATKQAVKAERLAARMNRTV